MQKIIILGGSGFLGTQLTKALLDLGYEVVVLDLVAPKVEGVRFVKANLLEKIPRDQNLKNPHAVINLAGKNIFCRWTKKNKQLIYDTRVVGSQNLIDLFQDKDFRPKILVGASAVGYYGNTDELPIDESSSAGNTFLSKVSADWEQTNCQAQGLGIRTVIIRNGIIVGSGGGILQTLLPIYRLGLGGPIGSGKFYFPWVSLQDAVGIYIAAMQHPGCKGVINAVAPEIVRYATFSLSLARAVRRPHIFRVPKFALRIRFGQLAEEITVSQKVYAKQIKNIGYPFIYKSLAQALEANISD
jgi:uncharacterized protein (TIGR01777 family)